MSTWQAVAVGVAVVLVAFGVLGWAIATAAGDADDKHGRPRG